MNLYFSTTLPRDAFLQEAFRRENIPLPSPLPRTASGKPVLPDGFFSLTHSGNFLAVAIGKEPVGLDAERRTARKTDAISKRLTEEERKEDLLELWTAKEAFVKYRGGTLARLLPRLVYTNGTLCSDNKLLPVVCKHFELEGCVLCLCTEKAEDPTPIRL